MQVIPCTIKTLPDDVQETAALRAVQINPANGLYLQALGQSSHQAPPSAEYLAAMTSKYWGARGVRLRVGFLDGAPANLRGRILAHMNAWGAWSNVRFVESNQDPQVRISRIPGGGYWSYLGTDILSIGAGQATMNLQDFSMSTSDAEFHRVVRHETGHTLGFPHEHMRKEIIERIDRDKAIAYFGRTQGWSPSQVVAQVLTPLTASALLATAKPDSTSVMCYWLPAEIMKNGVAVPGGRDIDPLDAQFAGVVYPGPVSPTGVWPNGKVYFFRGSEYLRYDVAADRTDSGYPLPVAGNWPGFPSSFATGFDAGVSWVNGKAYFFRSSKYIRYDIPTDRVDPGYPRAIEGAWPGLWSGGISAAVVWPNGKAYFFRGAEYMRYDIAMDRVDPSYPKPIKGNWPGMPSDFANGIDEAVVWNNGKAYMFRGTNYVRYDIAADRVDPGYPLPIKGHWPGLWESGVGTRGFHLGKVASTEELDPV